LAKFPVLRDEARNYTVAESTVIIEHLDESQPYFGMFPMERKLQVSTPPRRAGSQ
jgi:glutathione S-transferase